METRDIQLVLVLAVVFASEILSHQLDGTDTGSLYYSIGGVFSYSNSIVQFEKVLKSGRNESKNGITFLPKPIKMSSNPVRASFDVCEHLISQKVYAVVMSHDQADILSPAAISYSAGFYRIPVIDVSSRDSALSDKNVHATYLRTLPPYSHQADVWAQLLCKLKYSRVLFIHSSDINGRAILGRFQEVSSCLGHRCDGSSSLIKEENKIQMYATAEFDPGLDEFTVQLGEMKNMEAKVYLLYASLADAEIIFRDAELLKMTGEGYVWLVTEQALDAANVPIGTLGLRLLKSTNEDEHFHDIKYILTAALHDINSKENVTDAPNDCDSSGPVWETGKLLFEYIRQQVFIAGKTGKVAFDDNGDRTNAEYDLVNVQEIGEVPVGQYYFSSGQDKMDIKVDENTILWPGHLRTKPKGFLIPTHLNVLTIAEKPFVYIREVKWKKMLKNGKIDHVFKTAYQSKMNLSGLEEICHADEIPCPQFHTSDNAESIYTMYCCKGFCMELLKELAKKINFTYRLALSPDGQFGSYMLKDTSFGRKKQWTGLVGELVAKRADMVVAPLTINPERSEFIDFSKPFKYQGITILEKKPSRSSTLMSFLQPFSNTLWMLVLASVHVVALVLCLLDRFSPFSRFNVITPQDDTTSAPAGLASNCPSSSTVTTHTYTEEDALNLSSAIWFAWGVLLNSGIGDGTPRSFSGRVLGIVWAAFAMMIVASYTANLAAFLVLERPYSKPTGIHDAVLLNSFGNLTCATVNGSSVDIYFQRQVELSTLYHTMKVNNYNTSEEAIEDVKNGNLMAFIWDNSRLEYEAAMDCELVTTGEHFGRSGYGVGLQKDSPWADAVTLSILDFREDGFIESLEEKWFPQQDIQCDGMNPIEKRPNTLGLKNMAGVFMLVLAGIVGGVALIVIEVVYKRHHAKRQNKRELARYALDKWRSVVVKRRYIRATVAAHQQQMLQRRLKSNGINENPASTASSMPNEYTIGSLVPSSVGNVGSLAAAATSVDLKKQMSPRIDGVQFQAFN